MPGGCLGCQREDGIPLPFTMAFQPIVDTRDRAIFGREALVRGVNGEGAGSILSKVDIALHAPMAPDTSLVTFSS